MDSRRTFAKQALGLGALLTANRAGLGLVLGQDAAQASPGGAAAQAQVVYTGSGSLKAHAAARGLYVGTAVNLQLLARDANYAATLAAQYNLLVAENAMKWAGLRPGPDQFNFAEADQLFAFADAHGMKVRGHNLCWHEALPTWFAESVTKGNAQDFLTKHILAVAGHYKGRVRAWDVVNEAIDPKDGQPDGMRNSPWYKLLGPSYLDIAFHAARQADPAALLTYNDYAIETDGKQDTEKRAAVLALLRRLKRNNVPIDAVGIQAHLSADSAGQIGTGISEFVNECAALGLKVFITELDVNDDGLAADDPKERGREVATLYEAFVALLLKNPAVTDVLTWGVSDQASWLNSRGAKFRPKHPGREEVCLAFDDSYRPNLAFYGLRNALDTRAPSAPGKETAALLCC